MGVRPAVALAALVVLLLAPGCGRSGTRLQQELEMVPANALVHIHLSRPIPPQIVAMVPAQLVPLPPALIDSLLDYGELGITVAAIDITNLSPQLLVLMRDADPESVVADACGLLGCSADSSRDWINLRSGQGRFLGAVAERDDWTCMYLGPAPEVVLDGWLSLEREASLAADTTLALVSGGTSDLAILIPSNFLQFVRTSPISAWVDWWGDAESILAMIQPGAARLDFFYTGYLGIELRVVRERTKVARVRLELEDSGFTTGELLSTLQLLMNAGGLL
jgi:hypothetical protein